MRRELGLDLPERRIGLSAHDFAQLMGAESHPDHAREGRWHAGRGITLSASAEGRRRRRPLGRARKAGDEYLTLRTAGSAPHASKPIGQPTPKPPRAARPLAIVGHGDRGLAARSLHDLREAYPRLSPLDPVDMPCPRPIAVRPSTARSAISPQNIQDRCREPGRSAARDRREAFRAADGPSRGAGAVVAALSAHRQLVRRWEQSRRDGLSERILAEMRGPDFDSARRRPHFTLVRTCGPYRAAHRRPRHSRL